MPQKRPWKIYPQRLLNELNGTSGLAGVGGAILGATGLLAGPLATAVTGSGIAISVGAVTYAFFKAIPKKCPSPPDLVGNTIEVSTLQEMNPRVTSFAIVGLSQVGKTTIRHRLTHENATHARTQKETAHIIALQASPSRHIAILDGGGEKHPQQFKIAELADCLIIVIDHNSSDSEIQIDPKRLESHREFLVQVRNQLDHTRASTKRWIAVLINKSDLWEKAAPSDKAAFTSFYEQEVEKWRYGNRAASIIFRPHSNEKMQDIAALMADAKTLA